jgi:hypothetical protein
MAQVQMGRGAVEAGLFDFLFEFRHDGFAQVDALLRTRRLPVFQYTTATHTTNG